MWEEKKKRKKRNCSTRPGLVRHKTGHHDTPCGSDLDYCSAVTVADMVESWDLHNFLIQIANYACE
jgi:hypothetical protein